MTLWSLILYGLEIIIGAGIYVAIGEVMERAGAAAPLSFLLAGIAAAATGLCYAELAGRFPEAAGAVAFVRHGFGSERLALLVGVLMTLSVAVAAASITRGAVHYLAPLVPVPAEFLIIGQVAIFSVVAVAGIRPSVVLAAVFGTLEIVGLIAVTIVGFCNADEANVSAMLPLKAAEWRGILSAAFIAFFAFIGFETLANLAEEVKDPQRTLPRGILGAVAASIVLYVMVTTAAVLAGTPTERPLLSLFSGWNLTLFAAIAGVAVANGVLVHIVTLARLLYGTTRQGMLPATLGAVDPKTRTPIRATLIASSIILVIALFVQFEYLLVITNAATLAVFAIVDLALWHVKKTAPVETAVIAIPRWIPPCAAAISLGLIGIEFAS